MQEPPEILLFAGRFHPLLVHLPIGMLVALAVMEIAALFPRFKNANASAGFLLLLAVPLTIVTTVCGWMLAQAGGYEGSLIGWHKCLGTGTAAGCILTAILFQRGKTIAYRTSLLVTVALLLAAGHLGGSLTHGSDYLTRHAPATLKKLLGLPGLEKSSAADPLQLPVYAGVIAPILEGKCVGCHGPEKSKGALRLDSFAGVQKGGENGLVLQPGNVPQSPLMQRVLLPVDHDDHMPPDGKPQLSTGEIALLKWWIASGAGRTNTVAELQPPKEILDLLSARRQAR